LIEPHALLRSDAVRFRLWLATALALGAIAGTLLRAQVDEERSSQRDQSSEQQEARGVSSPKPAKSPSPVAKAKPAAKKLKKKRAASPAQEESPPIRKANPATGESKESPSPVAKAKAATEKSKPATEASPVAEESQYPRKGKLAKKSGEEEEVTQEPRPSETPQVRVVSQKRKKSPSPTPKLKTANRKSHKKEASPEPTKAAKAKTRGEEAPRPEKTQRPVSAETSVASESPTPPAPRAVAVPTPAPCPTPKIPRASAAEERAQVVIAKSGFEEEQGFEPTPSPPPRRFLFWPWSRPTSYRYLTRSVIEAIRRAPVKRRRWQFIVVHNSGTRQGNARAFDYYHRHVRRMQNGLAYHFVIGNGTSTGNGQIEVGDRWRRQINGGHVHSDYLNNISLGICLVGDFNRDQPTRAQLESCEELIRYLRERCGKTDRGEIPVRPHREMNPPRWPTDCPGDVFPYSWFRRFQ
jgi:N-acetylmuramoyl-L-alanine amidase-like protein